MSQFWTSSPGKPFAVDVQQFSKGLAFLHILNLLITNRQPRSHTSWERSWSANHRRLRLLTHPDVRPSDPPLIKKTDLCVAVHKPTKQSLPLASPPGYLQDADTHRHTFHASVQHPEFCKNAEIAIHGILISKDQGSHASSIDTPITTLSRAKRFSLAITVVPSLSQSYISPWITEARAPSRC